MLQRTSSKTYNVTVIDEPFIDVHYRADAAHVKRCGLEPSTRNFIPDPAKAKAMVEGLDYLETQPGGAGANTAAVVQKLGGRTCFVAAMSDSPDEQNYRRQLEHDGVDVVSLPSRNEDAMGRCYVMVDHELGERTMASTLPEKDPFHVHDLPEEKLRHSQFVFSQGYCWIPERKEALRHAFRITHEALGQVAFSLSAKECVEDNRKEFWDLLKNDIDVLFADEGEATSLCNTKTFQEAYVQLFAFSRQHPKKILVITQGEKGATILQNGHADLISPVPVAEVVDPCGAGDAFAGGVLYGLTHDMTPHAAGLLGAKVASKVISRVSARLQDEDVPAKPAYVIAGGVQKPGKLDPAIEGPAY